MRNQDRGEWFRSNDITYSSGAQTAFDLSFLDTPVGLYDFPVITEIEITFSGSVGDAAATALADDDGKAIVDQLLIRDGAGSRVNLLGEQIAMVEQLEYGSSYNQATAVALNTTDASYLCSWRIPFAPPHLSARPNDTSIPLGHLLNGGSVKITHAASLVDGTSPINSGTFNLRVRVRDDRRPEAKSRLVWDRITATAAEQIYAIHGSLRAAWFDVYDSNGSGLNDASAITELDSKTLQLFDRDVEDHINDYRASVRDRASNDYFLAVSTARHIPIIWPHEDDLIGRFPAIGALHLKQDGALVADQELVFCKIEDRDARLMARHFGKTEAAYLADLGRAGYAISAKGNHIPLDELPQVLRDRLPLRINAGALAG